MSAPVKRREFLELQRDPTAELIAGIAGVAFAKGDHEPHDFNVLTNFGEFEGTICRFDYPQYYKKNTTYDWIVYGVSVPYIVFKLCKPLHENGVIEALHLDIPEDGDFDFDWETLAWTI